MSTGLLGALTRPTPPARPVRPQVKERQFGLPSEALVAELHGADNATAMSTEQATTLPTPHARHPHGQAAAVGLALGGGQNFSSRFARRFGPCASRSASRMIWGFIS